MRDYESIRALIDANINKNGRQAITGQILNSVLKALVNTLGFGFQYVSTATPAIDPGVIDSKVFYVAFTPGRYEHFGDIVISEGEVAFIKHSEGQWTKESINVATRVSVDELKTQVEELASFLTGIAEALAGKMSFVELSSDGNTITMKDEETPLTYQQIKVMVDDPSKFVALKYGDMWWLLPQYDDGGAIIFTGTSLMSAQGSLDRVAINTENNVSSYSIAIENKFLKVDDLNIEQIDTFPTYPTTRAVNAKFTEQGEKVTELERKVNGENTEIDKTEDFEVGYFDANGNKITFSVTNWRCLSVDVSGGEVFSVKLKGTGNAGHTYSAIGYFVGNIFTRVLVSGGFVDYEDVFVAPENATRVVFTTLYNNPSIVYSVKEMVVSGGLIDDVNALRERVGKIEELNSLDVFVPKRVYQIRTQNMNVYPRNCITPTSKDIAFKSATKGYALSGNDMLWIRDAEATTSYSLLYKDEANGNLGDMSVVRVTPQNPSSKHFILPIGDSLMYSANLSHQGVYNNELSRLFNGVGNAVANGRPNGTMTNIEVIGTLGAEPVKHEGRSGWSAAEYLSKESLSGVNNAFYNPDKGTFDLDYYLSQNGFYTQGVTHDGSNLIVIICLNWNGVNKTWEAHTSSYEQLLLNIHASHPNARIAMLGMNCPPDHILRSATGGFTIPSADVIKRICIKIEKYLETLEGRFDYLYHIPILPFYYTEGSYPSASTWKPNIRSTSNLFVYTDYVHPNEIGYGQMADVTFDILCGLFFHS